MFLESLRGSVVFSVEHNFAIRGDPLAESIRSFNSRLCDPRSPLPGPSQGGDSIAHFLTSLMGGFASASPSVAGMDSGRLGGLSGIVVSSAAVAPPPPPFASAPFLPSSRPPLPPPGFLLPPPGLPPPLVPSTPSLFLAFGFACCLLFFFLDRLPVVICFLMSSSFSRFFGFSAFPYPSSLSFSTTPPFASVSPPVTSWSTPLSVASSLAPAPSFSFAPAPPVSSLPSLHAPTLSCPASSLFSYVPPVPSAFATSSSCFFNCPGSLFWQSVVSSLCGSGGWVWGASLSFCSWFVRNSFFCQSLPYRDGDEDSDHGNLDPQSSSRLALPRIFWEVVAS